MAQQKKFPEAGTTRTLQGKTFVSDGSKFVLTPEEDLTSNLPPAVTELPAPLGNFRFSKDRPMFMSDEAWGKLSTQQKLQNVLKFGGYTIASAFGMGEGGLDAVDNPSTTLALAAAGPVVKTAKSLLPSTTRAGATFESIMSHAKDLPVDPYATETVAMKLRQLADSGGKMPKVASDFLKRIHNENLGPLTYSQAREFYSNATRLSADEFSKLTPRIAREVGNLKKALGDSIVSTLDLVRPTLSKPYLAAMKEYAQASNLKEFGKQAKKVLIQKVLPAAAAGGAGGAAAQAGWSGMSKLKDMLGFDE
jgi:hypothetical protein